MKRVLLFAVLSMVGLGGCSHHHGHDTLGHGHEHDRRGGLPLALKVNMVLGGGDQAFETVPGWCKPPKDAKHFGETHGGVAVGKDGTVYFTLDKGEYGVVAYTKHGKFKRGFAKEFVGLHSLIIREEKGKEYLYAAHLKGKRVVKMSTKGKVALVFGYPKASGHYKKGNGRYNPTAVEVGPAGKIFVADGYGTSYVHIFDAKGTYLKSFGGYGRGDKQFVTCHGLMVDNRYDTPRLMVVDRENRRLVHYDFEGNLIGVAARGLRRPCAVSIHGDMVAVAELEGRVAILDKDHKLVATLGDNPNRKQWANFRVAEKDWNQGVFTAPHGLSYDKKGNLLVMDWNYLGRLTFLKKIKTD